MQVAVTAPPATVPVSIEGADIPCPHVLVGPWHSQPPGPDGGSTGCCKACKDLEAQVSEQLVQPGMGRRRVGRGGWTAGAGRGPPHAQAGIGARHIVQGQCRRVGGVGALTETQ